MKNPFAKYFAPKWKVLGAPDIKPVTGGRWIAFYCLQKGEEEIRGHARFAHKPTEKEALARAKEAAKTRNAGGDRHAFRLVDKESGRVLSVVHGVWTDPDTFEVTDMRIEGEK